ncbi:hypothetical protein ACQPW1_43685 [Nocardia sp. CA-128927]|uniref:hypothetical protein n=1 Tax=Nocardia sp. CA-128927 TaxID=3239975 RepID=UPI003D958031
MSKQTFCYVDHFAFMRIAYWLRKRHFGLTWGRLRRQFWPEYRIRAQASSCSGHDR